MEPVRPQPRVTSVAQELARPAALLRPSGADFADFYRSAYPRLVAVLTRSVATHREAEDLAQDAFSRLLPRWEKVSRYDDPEAWVRQVAFRLSVSRGRRLLTPAATTRRLGPPEMAPAPSESRVLVDDLLGRLSPQHRQVLVLHYGLDMPIREIAQALRTSPGTVKSRLSRARAAAAHILGEQA
jgi:RNA polymerase sigma-70 factor (ECF subfamily)